MKPRATRCAGESREPIDTLLMRPKGGPRPPSGQRLMLSCVWLTRRGHLGSGDLEFGDEDLALGLRAQQQRDDDADGSHDGSDQHRNGVTEIEVNSKKGQYRRHEP